jgi:hypothetical protein
MVTAMITAFPVNRRTTNMRRKKLRDHDLDDGDEIVPPGGRVRVDMTDAATERRRWVIRDALSKHQALCGHRPGYAEAILKWSPYERALEVGLADAISARDAAFAQLEKRSESAWRNGSALADAAPDQQMPPGLNGNGDDDDSEDDDDDDSELAKAMRDRERAYRERDARQRDAWRNPGRTDPDAANAVQRQAARWRNGA